MKTDSQTFRQLWRKKEMAFLKTNPFQLSRSIIKASTDFLKFFPNLDKLSDETGLIKDIRDTQMVKYGGIFSFPIMHSDVLLKIVMKSMNICQFQIAFAKDFEKIGEFILQHLYFSFH